jgi:hypothetical protein
VASKAALDLIIGLKDEASAKARTLGDIIKTGLGVAFGTYLVQGVKSAANELMSFTRLAGEEQLGIERLGAAVRATGADWGEAQTAIESYLAAELDRISLDDGDGRDALTRLTTATGDYQRALELLPLAADLARGKSIDLATASEIVGKVAEGNTAILSRYGITLEEGATATEALAALQERFGGQAEAYASTLVGQQERLSTAVGNLKESIGGALLPVLTNAATWLADLAVKYLPDVERAANSVVGGVSAFVGSLQSLFSGGLDGMVASFLVNNADTLASWGISIGDVWLAWENLKTWFSTSLPAIATSISEHLGTAKAWVEENWPGVRDAIQNRLSEAKTWIDENWPAVRDAVVAKLTEAKTWIDENWPGVRDEIRNRLSEAKSWIDTNMPLIRDEIRGKLEDVKTWVDENWPTIQATIIETLQGIQTESVPILRDIRANFITESETMKAWVDTNWPLMRATVEFETGLILKAVQWMSGQSTTAVDEEGKKQYNAFERWWAEMRLIAELYGIGPDSIRSRIQFSLQLINGDWEGAWNTMKETFERIWSEITLAFNIDGITAAIQRLIDAWNNARNAVGGGGGGGSDGGNGTSRRDGESPTPSMPSCPEGWHPEYIAGDWVCIRNAYASGTSWYPGGVGLVGEQGPELVELPVGSRIHSASETAGMLGTTHNWGPITINTVEGGTSIVDTLRLLSALGSAV